MDTSTASPRRTGRDALDAVLITSTVLMGLIAGVYYCFTCAIMPALADADDRVFIDFLQRVNDTIENPVFFLSFLGAFLVPLAAAIMQRRRGGGPVGRWIVTALVLYTLSIVTTVAFNIPLNEDLSDAGAPSAIADPAAVRADFEDPWIAWNIVRTLLATAAIGAMSYAILLRGRARAGHTDGA
ncbi:DUF1772 domain-containing protein [Streptodolium elevatio]|uniref:Anthrone oxygenase family protein n=1 Tax=Streptodolium elevatio TaxID=3157996 RepID=A0ABV3DVB8_9ACTN